MNIDIGYRKREIKLYINWCVLYYTVAEGMSFVALTQYTIPIISSGKRILSYKICKIQNDYLFLFVDTNNAKTGMFAILWT